MKEFEEPPTKLEFDNFEDDMPADGGKPEGESSDQQPVEGSDRRRTDGDEEGEESEPKPKKKTKPPTVDEYQWQWKACNLGSNFMLIHTDQILQPQLETTRRTFFL